MTEINQDPELLDDNEEGVGDEAAYEPFCLEYDHSQFELPDDYEEGDDNE